MTTQDRAETITFAQVHIPRTVPATVGHDRSGLSLVPKALVAIPALATLACAATPTIFLVWAAGKGFDITDEGVYLLGSQYPRDILIGATSAYSFTGVLFRLVGENVIGLRLVGLALTVLTALTLFAGLHAVRHRWDSEPQRRGWPRITAEASLIVAGGLLGYSWFQPTPSYNLLTAWGLSSAACTLFLGLARADGRAGETYVCMTAAGACLGLLCLTKFTSALSAGAVFAMVLLLWPSAPLGARAKWIAAVGVGFAIVFVAYFVLFQSPGDWIRSFRLGLWSAATLDDSHGAAAFLRYYRNWRDDVVLEIVKGQGWLLLGLVVLAVLQRVLPRDRWLGGRSLRIAVWLALAYAVYTSVIHLSTYPKSLWAYDITRFQFTWLLFLTLPALGWAGRRPRSTEDIPAGRLRARSLLILLLFLLPFCGALGTGNPLHFVMMYTIAPWFGLFVVLLSVLSLPGRTRWAVPVGAACLSAFCAMQVIGGSLDAPYRMRSGLRLQTHDTEVGAPATRLKLDAEMSAFLTDVRRTAAASGFKPGDDVLGLFDMPGVIFALGGRSPGVPWYTVGYPGSERVNERALGLIGPGRAGQAFIFQTTSSDAWLRTLGSFGIRFPDDYVLCGTLTIPYSWKREQVKWWRPLRRRTAP